MKNPTTITITACDDGGYHIEGEKNIRDYRTSEIRYAAESFSSLVNKLLLIFDVWNELEVEVQVKEKEK